MSGVYPDIMVDIETLDVKPTAVITSIGAVAFNLEEGTIGPSFETNIDIQSCLDNGLTVRGDTISFWMEQPEEARHAFLEDTQTLSVALCKFKVFAQDKFIWGKGPVFDNTILRTACEAVGESTWSYRKDMCYRTMERLGKMFNVEEPERDGTYHRSVDDAMHQAQYLLKVFKKLKGSGE